MLDFSKGKVVIRGEQVGYLVRKADKTEFVLAGEVKDLNFTERKKLGLKTETVEVVEVQPEPEVEVQAEPEVEVQAEIPEEPTEEPTIEEVTNQLRNRKSRRGMAEKFAEKVQEVEAQQSEVE